ncbi:TetR family transcriptional regulator [Sediminihabitans luteus]|uniref:TetR family transcriptional regulator n=1 Tax=Sediminihabitans luteus TaxID=1138585 RepID=A0A2M9CZL5_9CELL|nr:TetR family transcriptional regulator [Sediminihabitans luteus]PJJ77394.1 TetR family transcriptional regulator [Sediminihabitans luteus]GII98287.1 TetR family transcriptional regulator [Sediminihabitans luteus]
MDPRAARTQALLQDAIFALAAEQDLRTITVADVTERATVNRSTFYQHYADVETLLADALDREAARSDADVAAIQDAADPAAVLPVLVRYFEHLAEHAGVYRRALGPAGSPVATTRLRARMRRTAEASIRMHGHAVVRSGMPVEIAAAGIAGSVTGVAIAWLEMDPMPSAEVAVGWMWQLLTGQS